MIAETEQHGETSGLAEEGRHLSATPAAPRVGALQPSSLHQVSLGSGFWGSRQRLNAEKMIPHCIWWMERVGTVNNFSAAVSQSLSLERRGRQFTDSDVYKLLEAIAWELGRDESARLQLDYTRLVKLVTATQEHDGYINTNFGRPGQMPRFSDLENGHELYCIGHLIQAGVASLRSGLGGELMEAAVKAADLVCREFGPGARNGVCGHPEIETALVELSRTLGRPQYLEQARLFVERRGSGSLLPSEFGRQYFQDNCGVSERDAFEGHAVRALYLAAGVVDLAVESGDEILLDRIATQLQNTWSTRTYLTGGMGSRTDSESFGGDFELPSDGSYSESCAGVAAIHLAHRLLLATGDVRYADIVERVLYNIIASCPAADGSAYFYANTLFQPEQETPQDNSDGVSANAATSERRPWFAVSCCPPNVSRLLSSLGAYMMTSTSAGIQLQQFAGGEYAAQTASGPVRVAVVTDYPVSGEIVVRVLQGPDEDWEISARAPGWAETAIATFRGRVHHADAGGYITVRERFQAGDEVHLSFPIAPRFTQPHPRIDHVRGSLAIERGPLVYCFESLDVPDRLRLEDLRFGAAFTAVDSEEPVADGIPSIMVEVESASIEQQAWPYEPAGVKIDEVAGTGRTTAIPYFFRGNRGPGSMRVWVPRASSETD